MAAKLNHVLIKPMAIHLRNEILSRMMQYRSRMNVATVWEDRGHRLGAMAEIR